jgi:hypothetical protein
MRALLSCLKRVASLNVGISMKKAWAEEITVNIRKTKIKKISTGILPPRIKVGISQITIISAIGRAEKGVTIALVRTTKAGKLVSGKPTSTTIQRMLDILSEILRKRFTV